jgi:hypothetical protein
MYAWSDIHALRVESGSVVGPKLRRGGPDHLLWHGSGHNPPIRKVFYPLDVDATRGGLAALVPDEADILLKASRNVDGRSNGKNLAQANGGAEAAVGSLSERVTRTSAYPKTWEDYRQQMPEEDRIFWLALNFQDSEINLSDRGDHSRNDGPEAAPLLPSL